MHDDALIAWLEGGAQIVPPDDEARAKERREFSLRFSAALNPPDDLGPTCEAHEAAVARGVYAVHMDLNALGEEAYSAVWSTLAAGPRAAIKKYIAQAKSAPQEQAST
jgi:hypothetical protein